MTLKMCFDMCMRAAKETTARVWLLDLDTFTSVGACALVCFCLALLLWYLGFVIDEVCCEVNTRFQLECQ